MKYVVRLVAWVRRTALAIVLVLTAAAVALCVYTVIRNQHERTHFIYANCLDQNARHRGTVRELNLLTAQREATLSPARRAQLKVSKGFTILLIDQLAPLQDCDAVVARSTSTR